MQARGVSSTTRKPEEEEELRRGPWTVEEDLILANHIAHHGEGRWNAVALAAGLHRTGKSCRLRWLNYLRPDVKRGDFTAAEQLLILDLHSRWGNRWSKIAREMPGRTDNEVKNYWRTKVMKHAKQMGCDVASPRFKDAMSTYLLRTPGSVAHHQQQRHCSGNDDDKPSLLATSPCLSVLAPADTDHHPAASSSSLAETSYHYYPGSGSSSTSSLTSTEWTPAHDEKSVQQLPLSYGGNGRGSGEDSGWTMHGGELLWSTADQLDDDLLQDLTGWVQGFTDADHSQMWSLDDDIWTTMQ